MLRIILLKKILLISGFLLIVLTGCSDPAGTVNTPNYPAIKVLSGKIQGWTYGVDKVAQFSGGFNNRAYIFGSSPIDSAGNFSITLTDPPDSILLSFPSDRHEFCTYKFNPANPAVKELKANINVLRGSQLVGIIQYGNMDPNNIPNRFTEIYRYFDSDFVMTGQCVCGDSLSREVLNYNFNGSKGWNALFVRGEGSESAPASLSSGNRPPDGFWMILFF